MSPLVVLSTLLAVSSAYEFGDRRERRQKSVFQPYAPLTLLAGPTGPGQLITSPFPTYPNGQIPDPRLPDILNNLDPANNPYLDVPPPPPPTGPPPPYSVNFARGLTYASAPTAPSARTSYAPSPRISYGGSAALARIGYTAPPIEVAAPALLLTPAKHGGLAQPPSPYPSPLDYQPIYPVPRPVPAPAPIPYQYAPQVPQNLPVPVDPLTLRSPPPTYGTAPPGTQTLSRGPGDSAPQQFVQSFIPPLVTPILTSRNRFGALPPPQSPLFLGSLGQQPPTLYSQSTNYLR